MKPESDQRETIPLVLADRDLGYIAGTGQAPRHHLADALAVAGNQSEVVVKLELGA